jgi:putative ABC transport system permease protein
LAGIGRGRLTTGALRYRAGQAAALFVLSLLGIAACAFGPLYERAVEGAQLSTTLAQTPVFSRGLTARTTPAGRTTDIFASNTNIRRFYGAPVTSDRLAVTYTQHDLNLVGDIVSRTAQCDHLPVTTGRCPTAASEVMASRSSARALGLRIGGRLLVTADPRHGVKPEHYRLTIVGFYGSYNPHDDYWFDQEYFTAAGVYSVQARLTTYYVPNPLIAGEGFGDTVAPSLPVSTQIDVPLKVDRVGLDDMSALRAGVAALSTTSAGAAVQVTSNLGSVFDQVESGRRAARSVIPAFAAELALLLLVVIGIVVVAGADHRRPELALARLRGSSTGRAARRFSAELGVPVILSVIPGLLVAWLASAAASRWWLSGLVHPQLRWPVLGAAGAVMVVELAVVGLVARATARRPVHDLIRRSPAHASGRGTKVAEAGLAAAAIAGTVVVLSGDRHNAIAIITPGLIALLAGMLLSHLLAAFSRIAGRRALWRGRLATGLAGLRIARRPAVRRIVVLLCVASALAVAAADEWRVSARNRFVRAGAEAGASVALTVHAADVKALRDAVAAADPSGGYATPVVIQRPPDSGPAVVAMQPASFARIAAWGWPRDQPTAAMTAALSPALPKPISLTGTSMQLRLTDESLSRRKLVDGGSPAPAYLLALLRRASGDIYVRLGPLPAGHHESVALSATIPCADGCRLAQLAVSRSTADTGGTQFDATITGLYAGTRGALGQVSLGTAADWGEATPETSATDGSAEKISLGDAGGELDLSFFYGGAPEALQHLAVPVAVPAVTAGDVPPDLDPQGNLNVRNIDSVPTAFRPVGHLEFVPGDVGPALLVDIDLAAAVAAPTLADSTTAVWLGADDPARERAFVAALERHGVSVISRDTAAEHRATLAATAPAWAMQAALIAALLAVLIAALLILISATMSRRERAGDASALGLVGVDRATLRRATLLEHLVAVVTAVLVGTAVGVVGAQLALPATPIFLARLEAPGIVRYAAWGSILLAAAYTLAALVVAGVATSLVLARRIAPLPDIEQ